MCRRVILFLLTASVAFTLPAQEKFTDKLQKRVEGQGVVVLHQDEEIDALVNGTPVSKALPQTTVKKNSIVSVQDSLEVLDNSLLSGKRVRRTGFRIQVYAGGTSRDAMYKAQQMEGKVKTYYPMLNTYTRFVSPRWICHVGDFLTREEAMEVLNDMRSKGGFDEAIVVKCKVNALVPN